MSSDFLLKVLKTMFAFVQTERRRLQMNVQTSGLHTNRDQVLTFHLEYKSNHGYSNSKTNYCLVASIDTSEELGSFLYNQLQKLKGLDCSVKIQLYRKCGCLVLWRSLYPDS